VVGSKGERRSLYSLIFKEVYEREADETHHYDGPFLPIKQYELVKFVQQGCSICNQDRQVTSQDLETDLRTARFLL
jgi:hypothetical protein